MAKSDKIIIILVALIGLISLIPYLKLSNLDVYNQESFAVIRVDGLEVKRISLDKSQGIYDFPFTNKIGYVEIKNGSIRMVEMDRITCPEGICSNTGWIKSNYQVIVCLPNKITVHIENKIKFEVDAMLS